MRALLLALFVLIAPAALAGERDFRNWHTACGDDGYCAATTEAGGDLLRVARHAEQSYWEVSFVSGSSQADEWQDFIVDVDGQTETFGLRSEIGAYGSITDFYLLGEKAQRVMDLMMPGETLRLRYTDTTARPRVVDFPLAGLTAALLWIDEQQGRIGSERVASVPPHGLTPAGQEQIEVPVIPQAVMDRHFADPDCEPFEQLANGRDFTVAPLDTDYTLYLIPCWAGAYNFGSKAYVRSSSADAVEQLYFADYSDYAGWTGTPYLVNAYYDPEFKELGSFSKARGTGDCGSSGTWKWTGSAFRLEEFRARECTDGPIDENEEVGDFPVIFTAPPLPGGDNG